MQGIACIAADRAHYRDSRSHDIADRALSSLTFGVVIVTRKSFANPYSIEEFRTFLARKNLVPLFFDLGPEDCLARDIIEKRVILGFTSYYMHINMWIQKNTWKGRYLRKMCKEECSTREPYIMKSPLFNARHPRRVKTRM